MFDLFQNGGALSTILYAFVGASIIAVLYMGYMVRRTELKAEQRLKQARADITDMTILFQTMRDIIGQQKSLAKDFNEELEHKMGQVKHILNQGMEKNKQLYDKQQRIVGELEEAQAQIDGLFRQISHLEKSSPAATSIAKPEAPEKSAPRSPAIPVQRPVVKRTENTPLERVQRTSTSVVIRTATADARDLPAPSRPRTARPESGLPPRPTAKASSPPALTPAEEARLADTGVTRAPFTSWIAEDLSRPNREPARAPETPRPLAPTMPSAAQPAAAPSRPPVETRSATPSFTPRPPAPPVEDNDFETRGPSNGDAAREAFRALLNMPMSNDAAPLEMPGQARGMAAALQEAANKTEENHMSVPLQQRVLEYSEAGMTVAEVSRELGIGKGEVRLMLSLARQATPPQ